MKETKKTKYNVRFYLIKTLYVFFLFMIIFFITGCFKNNPSEEEIKKGHQELLEIKNNLTKDSLIDCKFETWQCTVDVDKIDMNELAKILNKYIQYLENFHMHLFH